MFRGGMKLTEAEQAALSEQAKRIEALGAQWEPTEETLAEVLLAVKLAGNEEHRMLQRRGIDAARDSGITLGRPKKQQPANFPDLVSAIRCGELTRVTVAKTLGVSQETLRRWLREYEAAQLTTV